MGEQGGLRIIRAANPAPLTLDGTRTHIVGRSRAAIIDPGPDLPVHLDAVAEAIGDGVVVSMLLTHDHPDHAGGAASLASRLNAPVQWLGDGTLVDRGRIDTDAGVLIAIATPGHTRDHVAFHWPDGGTVFVGDLMLGGLDTALVAPPEGDLGEYLRSLARVRLCAADTLRPAHGEPFADPEAAIERYLAHREERLARVQAALVAAGPGGASLDDVTGAVYGPSLPPALRPAATGAALAYLEHLTRSGEAHREEDGRWRA